MTIKVSANASTHARDFNEHLSLTNNERQVWESKYIIHQWKGLIEYDMELQSDFSDKRLEEESGDDVNTAVYVIREKMTEEIALLAQRAVINAILVT